jgi:hypothetical protein
MMMRSAYLPTDLIIDTLLGHEERMTPRQESFDCRERRFEVGWLIDSFPQ